MKFQDKRNTRRILALERLQSALKKLEATKSKDKKVPADKNEERIKKEIDILNSKILKS